MNEQSQDLLAAFENPEMAPEMPAQQVSPNAAPIYPEAPVAPAPVAPAVEPAPVAPVAAAPVEDNQNTMPNVSEEPAVAVTQEVRNEEVKDDTPSVKKNLIFIAIICVIIAAFIIFLPKIMGLLNGGF